MGKRYWKVVEVPAAARMDGVKEPLPGRWIVLYGGKVARVKVDNEKARQYVIKHQMHPCQYVWGAELVYVEAGEPVNV